MTAAKQKNKELETTGATNYPTKEQLAGMLLVENLNKLEKKYNPELIPKAKEKGDAEYLVIHAMVMDITKVRTNIEAKRKEIKKDSLEFGKLVDSKAKELTASVEAIEAPWKKLKTDLDEKEAREAEEARQRELEAMQIIEAKVEQLKGATNGLVGKTLAALKERLATLCAVVIDESYGEYVEAAQFHKDNALGILDSAIAERETFEEQQAQLKANQDALASAQKEIDDKAAKAQKEIDEKSAELDRIHQENEQAAADKMAEQQKKMDEQQASLDKQKAEQEEQETAEKQRKEDEAFAELEEKQRKEKEAAEAEAKKLRDAELDKRLPEDVKMRTYLSGLRSVELPDVKNEDMQALLVKVLMKLDELSELVFDGTQEQSGI